MCVGNTASISIVDAMQQSITLTARDYKVSGDRVDWEKYGADSEITIKDATDQTIKMKAKNYLTANEKGVKSLGGRDSRVEVTDAAGQTIVMTAKDDKNLNKHDTEENIDAATLGSQIELISADKGTFIRLSNEKIELVAGTVPLTLDKASNTISLNSGAGSTMTMASDQTSIQAGRIDLN